MSVRQNIIPLYDEWSSAFLVSEEILKPRQVETIWGPVLTAPYRTGIEIDILQLDAATVVSNNPLLESDMLRLPLILKSAYLRFGKDVVRFDMNAYFTRASASDPTAFKLNTKFARRISEATKQADGSDLVDLAERVTGVHRRHILLELAGKVVADRGLVRVTAIGGILGSGNLNEFEVIGYDLTAYRTNSNAKPE